MIKIKDEPVTKPARVTIVHKATLAALRNAIGRPRKHSTAAERQKAYRARKKAAT